MLSENLNVLAVHEGDVSVDDVIDVVYVINAVVIVRAVTGLTTLSLSTGYFIWTATYTRSGPVTLLHRP